MSKIRAEVHYILQFYFEKSTNAVQAHKTSASYDPDALSEETAQRLSSSFCSGHSDVENVSLTK